MTQILNRRELLRQTALGLTTFFCVGRLQFDIATDCGDDCVDEDLHLAAATSLEFWIQNLLIPYGRVDGPFELSPEMRAKGYEVSKWLNPSNAPRIFQEAKVLLRQGEVVVQFSDAVSVSLPKRSMTQVRRSLTKHPRVHFDVPNTDDRQIVEYIVQSFTYEENWKYD
jgi:hypothetical protein